MTSLYDILPSELVDDEVVKFLSLEELYPIRHKFEDLYADRLETASPVEILKIGLIYEDLALIHYLVEDMEDPVPYLKELSLDLMDGALEDYSRLNALVNLFKEGGTLYRDELLTSLRNDYYFLRDLDDNQRLVMLSHDILDTIDEEMYSIYELGYSYIRDDFLDKNIDLQLVRAILRIIDREGYVPETFVVDLYEFTDDDEYVDYLLSLEEEILDSIYGGYLS